MLATLQNSDYSDRRSYRWIPTILLLLCFAAALFLRLRGLGVQNLWYDEVLTWHSATAPPNRILTTLRHYENTPPLYFLILNAWVRMFGDGEIALRLPSALFGAACIPAAYWLAKEMWNRTAGMVFAVMLTTSPYHLWYSQEARTYSLLFLLVLCASATLVRLLRQPSRWAMAGYVVFNILAFYAHSFALFALVAQMVFFLAMYAGRRRDHTPALALRSWFTLNGLILIALIPWVPILIDLAGKGQPWLTRNSTLGEAFLAYTGSLPLLLLMLILALVAVGAAIYLRDRKMVLAVAMLVLPIVCPLLLSTPRQPAFHTRYGILSLIGLGLLSSYAVAQLRPWARGIVLIAYVALTIPLIQRAGYPQYPGVLIRLDLRSPARFIEEQASPGDRIVLQDAWFTKMVFEHYFDRQDIKIIDPSQIETMQDPKRRIWLVSPVESKVQGTLDAAAKESYDVRAGWAFNGIELRELVPVERNPGLQ